MLPSIYWTVSTLVLVYKQKQSFADVLQNGCYWIAKFTRKHHWRGSFFNETALLRKETLAQLSFYEFCEIFKKIFLIEHRCFCIKLVIDFESQWPNYRIQGKCCELQLGIWVTSKCKLNVASKRKWDTCYTKSTSYYLRIKSWVTS